MIATDIAGRGIDVKGVTHVINYDLPKDISQYTHRYTIILALPPALPISHFVTSHSRPPFSSLLLQLRSYWTSGYRGSRDLIHDERRRRDHVRSQKDAAGDQQPGSSRASLPRGSQKPTRYTTRSHPPRAIKAHRVTGQVQMKKRETVIYA